MMNLKGFAKAASVAAMTVGVAFAATPAQKASAQVVGAGASSVTGLANQVRDPFGPGAGNPFFFNGANARYIVTGSGAGRTAFLNFVDGVDGNQAQFVATDGLSNLAGRVASGEFVAFQEANLNVAFPYNVPGFDVTIDGPTACRIFRGDVNNVNENGDSDPDPTNWNQVINVNLEVGPDLPIIRVARGDSSGTTDTLQSGNSAGGIGFVEICNGKSAALPGPAAPTFDTNPIPAINNPGDVITIDGVDSGLRVRQFNLIDGTLIPNQRSTDIIVSAATVDGVTADPFGLASLTGDDDNSGSYSFGIASTIANTPGAIGYTETSIANAFGLPLAVDSDFGTSTIAVGPTFVVFNATGNGDNTDALRLACRAFTDNDNLVAAGFSTTPVPGFPNGEIGPDGLQSGGSDRCDTDINP